MILVYGQPQTVCDDISTKIDIKSERSFDVAVADRSQDTRRTWPEDWCIVGFSDYTCRLVLVILQCFQAKPTSENWCIFTEKNIFVASMHATCSTHLIVTMLYHQITLIWRTALLCRISSMKCSDSIVQYVYNATLWFWRHFKIMPISSDVKDLLYITGVQFAA
jgi:hypothetical protein